MCLNLIVKPFCLVIASLLFFSAGAQQKNQLSLNVGLYSAPQYLNDFADNFLVPVITIGLADHRSEVSYPGVPYLSYVHHAGPKFSYGADFVSDRFSKDVFEASSGDKLANYKYNIYSLLFRGDYNFIHSEKVRLYINLAMGIGYAHTIATETDVVDIGNTTAFAFNFTPLGFSYKTGKHFCLNAETSFGNKPLIAIGAGYSF